MNLKEYQEAALKTALPTALTASYLVPMIVGEVGELFGKVAKANRDKWTKERVYEELAKEYGDICWGTAVLLHTAGIDEVTTVGVAGDFTFHEALDELMLCARGIYNTAYEAEERGAQPGTWPVERMWYALHAFCAVITRRNFDEVLQMNLDKLASRQERGTISGSGDNR